jgi:pteridine reductase
MITGAAKRLGRGMALHLASCGANLIIHYHHSETEARELQKKIRLKFKTKVSLLQGDLKNFSELQRVAKESWKVFGKIDVLINNASTFYPTPVGKVSRAQWEDLFNVNARAPFFLSEAIGLKMKKRGRGKIINIADWAALRPDTRYVPYCASKAALIAISQGMAKSLAPEVQINTILPGPVMWPEGLDDKVKASVLSKTPLKKIGKPEDIAMAAQYLIEGGDFMTGSLLHVDGGRNIY